MSEASYFMKHSDRWANELWNLSLLPVAPQNEAGPMPSRLENVDGARSARSFHDALRLKRRVSGDTLT
jgi:hypothetical protein